MNAPKCPACGSQTDEGFVPDRSDSSVVVPKWTAGPPERSFWQGLNLKDRERLSITTYRCRNCGLLQSYARAT